MINISSKEGEGTTVTITLPVAGELDREQLSTGVVE
jgi:signal transduction histidine kinase